MNKNNKMQKIVAWVLIGVMILALISAMLIAVFAH